MSRRGKRGQGGSLQRGTELHLEGPGIHKEVQFYLPFEIKAVSKMTIEEESTTGRLVCIFTCLHFDILCQQDASVVTALAT